MPVNVFFRKDKDYRIHPVSGVWGGLTPHGLISCDFFFERAETPERLTIEDDSREVSRSPETPMIIRELLAGISLRPEVARSIGQWFIAQAEEFDRIQGR